MSTNSKFPPRGGANLKLVKPEMTIDELEEAVTAIERDRMNVAPTSIEKAIAQGEARQRARRATERDEATPPDKRETYPPPTSSAELASADYPPQAYTVDKLIMAERPQTLDGDGGIGKSNASVGMAVAVAAGKPIFGRATIQGPVLFVTHEDDKPDLQAMAQGYADYIGEDLAALPVDWWSLLENDITLAVVNDDGSWKRGPFYDVFEAKLRESGNGLFIVLDCRSDVVQMNEILREPPNTFYKTVLTPLCKRYGCTILVLCHPSKASMNDGSYYSGGTGNKSALRNKLVMKLADESPDADPLGPRLLDVLKRNRGTRDKTAVRLTFDPLREIYVADDDAAVQRDTAKQYGVVVEQIKAMLGADVVVQVGNTGSGQGPRDVAAALAKLGTPVPEKNVKAIMKAALRDGVLGYHDAAPGQRIKAGFHIIDAAADFGDGPDPE